MFKMLPYQIKMMKQELFVFLVALLKILKVNQPSVTLNIQVIQVNLMETLLPPVMPH